MSLVGAPTATTVAVRINGASGEMRSRYPIMDEIISW